MAEENCNVVLLDFFGLKTNNNVLRQWKNNKANIYWEVTEYSNQDVEVSIFSPDKTLEDARCILKAGDFQKEIKFRKRGGGVGTYALISKGTRSEIPSTLDLCLVLL